MIEMSVSGLNFQVLHEVVSLMGLRLPPRAAAWLPRGGPADELAARWVSSQELDALYCDLVAMTGRSDFGLMAACSPAIARVGILPMLIMHSPHLAEALQNIIKFAALLQSEPELTLQDEGAHTRLYLDVMHSSPTGLVVRSEFVALGLTHILRLVGLGRAGLVRLALAYPAPPHADQYRQYFDCDVRFDAPRNELVFESALLKGAVPGADPMLYSAILARANMALSELKGQRGLVNEVSAFVLTHLAERPRMEDVAQALGLHERTLRRRLAELGVDYQALMQRFQLERSRALLAEGRRSIQQIAGDVGFGSVSAFHRAFLRWTGHTPKAWRDACEGGQG